MNISDDLQQLVVGDRRFPVMLYEAHDMPLPGSDYVMHVRRCRLRIEAGFELSLLWGNGTYSSNCDAGWPDLPNYQPFTEEPTTVEVGVFDRNDEWLFDGEPLGYVDAKSLVELIDALSTGVVPEVP